MLELLDGGPDVLFGTLIRSWRLLPLRLRRLRGNVTVLLVTLLLIIPLEFRHSFDFFLSILENFVRLLQLLLDLLLCQPRAVDLVAKLSVHGVKLVLVFIECGLYDAFEVFDLFGHFLLAFVKLFLSFVLGLFHLVSMLH